MPGEVAVANGNSYYCEELPDFICLFLPYAITVVFAIVFYVVVLLMFFKYAFSKAAL